MRLSDREPIMKKNTRLFVCLIILSILIVNIFTPLEKISHDVVSFTIELLQPDETFQAGQIELKSNDEQEAQAIVEINETSLTQRLLSLSKEVSHDLA